MRSLILRPEAEAEVEEAFRWYEERSPGLGAEFAGAIGSALEGIRRQPERFPLVFKQVRQGLLRRFPYCLHFFMQRDGGVEVISCFHTRRNPRRWRSRV
jgi:toxin ParE1/3/4